jgi:hypothetical protein
MRPANEQIVHECCLIALWASGAARERWKSLGLDSAMFADHDIEDAASLILSGQRGNVAEHIYALLTGERAKSWGRDPGFCILCVDRFAKETAAAWLPGFFFHVGRRLTNGAAPEVVVDEIDWLLTLYRPPVAAGAPACEVA